MNYHEALYMLYHSVCQTKMSANVHYIPIHQNLLFAKCIVCMVYSFQPKCILVYLSITMHFNQSQTSFTGYDVTACYTSMASISLHFDWLI